MTTVLNNFPQSPGTRTSTSCPGTPLSGVSTVAIKDGHEGIRHSYHQGQDSAQERLSNLDAYTGGGGEGYFERVSGWQDHDEGGGQLRNPSQQEQHGEEPTREISESPLAMDESANGTPDGVNTPPGLEPRQSLTQKIVEKLKPKGKIPIPPWRAPNPPCPTPATPLTQARMPLSQGPSSYPGPNNWMTSSGSSSNAASYLGGNGLITPYSTGAPSPSSTITTSSVREAKHCAKMLGPITYDSGVIDTTRQNGAETRQSPSPPPPVNDLSLQESDRMDLDPRGEGGRKERLDVIEERIASGPHGPFQD